MKDHPAPPRPVLEVHTHTWEQCFKFKSSASIIRWIIQSQTHQRELHAEDTEDGFQLTGPLNNWSTNSGHNLNGSSSFSSSGGIGVINLKLLGVGGMGISVDLEMGVIGGDGGII